MNRLRWRPARPAGPGAGQREVGYAILAALLRYPDDTLVRDLPLLAAAADSVPAAVSDPLRRLIAHVTETPLLDLQAEYVATFDLRRKCCLHLSYYMNGDTRRRGEAIWQFARACRQAGFQVSGGELPDFLPVVLELAAVGHEATAVDLIQQHRAGITMLGGALAKLGSPYADACRALEALLPAAPVGAIAQAVKLAEHGPPSELVGLGSAALDGYRAENVTTRESDAP